ncbi:MAG: hypothetical protein WA964_17635 [Ilumatobacter sp.]|uniref:hypothetical protein n=1 Tax=Ilumatobacter sp. TaxID=1967498 RepID=UPI003C70E6D6
MNAYLRTLPLPSAVRPVREHGASALDRVVTGWPAPTASARVLDRWGMPPREESLAIVPAEWPAPDPVMRFELPAPDLGRSGTSANGRIPWVDLVEPRYSVEAPDLHVAARTAVAPPAEPTARPAWPAPTPGTAEPIASVQSAPTGISRRVVVGLAAAAGALAAGAAVLVTLF